MRRPALAAVVMLMAMGGCMGEGATLQPPAADPRLAAYLLPSPFQNLTIEVDFAEGWPPSDFVLDALVDAVRGVVSKDAVNLSIGRAVGAPGPETGKTWSREDLEGVARESIDLRDPGAYGRGEEAVLHVLFLHGDYLVDGEPVAGVAIDGTAYIFAWGGAISDLPLTDASAREYRDRSVAIHEVGHVLGLVNNGVPMVRDHEDPASRHHSRNSKSVMHAYIDSMSAYSALLDPREAPPHEFDADDLADLRAFVTAAGAG